MIKLVPRKSSFVLEDWLSSAQKLQKAAEQHQANGKMIEAVGAWKQMSGVIHLLLKHPMAPSVSGTLSILHAFTIPANVGLCFLHHLKISTLEFSRTPFFDEMAMRTLKELHLPVLYMRYSGGPVIQVPHSVWPEISTKAKHAKICLSYAAAFRLLPVGRSSFLQLVRRMSKYVRLADHLDPGNV